MDEQNPISHHLRSRGFKVVQDFVHPQYDECQNSYSIRGITFGEVGQVGNASNSAETPSNCGFGNQGHEPLKPKRTVDRKLPTIVKRLSTNMIDGVYLLVGRPDFCDG